MLPLKVLSNILLLIHITSVNSGRILVSIAINSFSHQVFYRPLWKELAKRGHELVIITSHPMNDPSIKNIREISTSASNIIFEELTDSFMSEPNKFQVTLRFIRTLSNITRNHLSNPEVLHLFNSKDEHFDLLMMEFVIPSLIMLKHRFQVPTIGLASTDAKYALHSYVGNPVHEILYPNIEGTVVDNGLIDRIIVIISKVLANILLTVVINNEFETVKEVLGPGYPSYSQVESNVDMVFANFNPMFTEIRPKSEASVSLAGLHIQRPVPLPKDFQKFLDASTNGVIYMSLGSNTKSAHLTNSTLAVILETFRQLPYNILWKYESENQQNIPPNVKLAKWLPQQDVLSHKKVVAFVTQGGLQSLEEALFFHIPVVVFPYLFDQEHNARHVVMNGLGISMDPTSLTVQTFKAALLEVITNTTYKQTIIKQANTLNDQPMTALERAVWWTEYVLRHKGAKHLHGAKIPLHQELYLDVLSFLIVAILLIFAGIYYISKFLRHKMSNQYGNEIKYE